jgi:hypothetical protein
LCENVPEELYTLMEEEEGVISDGRREGVLIGVDTCEWY